MLCSQPSSAPTVSWLSANQSEPSLLSQSQQPFPLFGRDVECADVEPCNSILLNKSSRSFLRKHIEFHQKYPCSRNPLILKITKRSLLPFPLSAAVFPVLHQQQLCRPAVQSRPPSEAAVTVYLPPAPTSVVKQSCISIKTAPTRHRTVLNEQ